MKKLTLAILSLLTLSCSTTPKEYASLYEMFPRERTLSAQSERVVCDPPFIAANKGAIYNSHLIASIYASGYKQEIVVIDLKTGQRVSAILPEGRGRNESINPYFIGLQQDDIVCTDMHRSTILKLQFDEVFKPNSQQNWRSTDLLWEGLLGNKINFGALKNDRYIFCGCREEGLFEILDSSSNVPYVFGEYQKLDGNEPESQLPYAGNFCVSPSQKRALYYSQFGNILYFYDVSNASSEPRLLNKYYFDLAKGQVTYHNGMAVAMGPDQSDLLGVVSATASSENFYLLNSQKSYSEVVEPCDMASDTVLVFDKNGNPIEKITLDRGVINIYYNDDDNSLYSIVEDDEGDTTILKYKLLLAR